ncbi:MAG: CoA transferase [Holophagales bacterium]|nr:CoA transferase [Holophagales bacterium]MYF94773.1 CoA transferase [Holophagales bacterium]
MADPPCSDLRVIEVAGSPAGAYAARLLALCGADVLRIEPPDGDPWREVGERWRDVGAEYAYLNLGKRAARLRPSADGGRAQVLELVERSGADVIIESGAPGPLEPLIDEADAPHAVLLRISPFGLGAGGRDVWSETGPPRSNEFTDDAWSGHTFLNGRADREPIARPGLHAHCQAGAHAAIGGLAALLARSRIGRGQTVDVSHVEGLAAMHQYTTVMWTQARHVLPRVGNTQGGPWHPIGVYRCKDGYVFLAMPSWEMVRPFLLAAGLDAVVEDARFVRDVDRAHHRLEFDRAIEPWLLAHTTAEIIELGVRARVPIGPIHDALGVLEDPHFRAREFFVPIDGAEGPLVPRGPFVLDGKALVLSLGDATIGPAPLLDDAPAWSSPGGSAGEGDAALDRGPLQGVRVLDLTRVWAGPLATRILGDLGADVIKVEAAWSRGPATRPARDGALSHLFPEDDVGERPFNRSAAFNKMNRNKRSLTLELDDPEAKRLFERMVERADVVCDNFSPRVMPKLGLDADRLREINPRVVAVAMPGFGHSGPYRDRLAYGPLIEASMGLTSHIGYRGGPPCRSGVAWPDPVTALHTVVGTLAMLYRRSRSPEGAGGTVETPMVEATATTFGDSILTAQLRGSAEPRRGNRHPRRAPQGCYPCAGEDRWIAISVESDREWRALCRISGLAPRFASMSLEQRQTEEDRIDDLLADWTRDQERGSLVESLHRVGVTAAPVADGRDLAENQFLEARRFWAEVDHPEVGRRRYPGLPIRLSATPATYRRGAPCLGEHNREVLVEVLGFEDMRVDELERAGVLRDTPPAGATGRGVKKD